MLSEGGETFWAVRGCIVSDDEAKLALSLERPCSDVATTLLEVAREVSNVYSFVSHQTYPRPGHPLVDKRLSPEFTYTAIITSLRCTLETEQRVVDNLISTTHGDPNALRSIGVAELENILRPAGMAKQKSLWIKGGLDTFKSAPEYHFDTLRQPPIEEARQRLLKIKGMGPKAVDCFLLLGLDMPIFPIDVNVFKLVARLFPEHITDRPDIEPSFSNPKHVRSTKLLLESSFTPDTSLYQILHTYLLLAEKYKIVT
jgi:endonuclease III